MAVAAVVPAGLETITIIFHKPAVSSRRKQVFFNRKCGTIYARCVQLYALYTPALKT